MRTGDGQPALSEGKGSQRFAKYKDGPRWVACWLGRQPVHQKVAGSVPVGARRQGGKATDQCISLTSKFLSPPPPPSLINKHILG